MTIQKDQRNKNNNQSNQYYYHSSSSSGNGNESTKKRVVSSDWHTACEKSMWHYNTARLCMVALSVGCIMLFFRRHQRAKKTPFWRLVYTILTLLFLIFIGCGITISSAAPTVFTVVRSCLFGIYTTAAPWMCASSIVFICCDVFILLWGSAFAFAYVPLYFFK